MKGNQDHWLVIKGVIGVWWIDSFADEMDDTNDFRDNSLAYWYKLGELSGKRRFESEYRWSRLSENTEYLSISSRVESGRESGGLRLRRPFCTEPNPELWLEDRVRGVLWLDDGEENVGEGQLLLCQYPPATHEAFVRFVPCGEELY